MRFTNPYLRLARLHQPVGIWLLMWPCFWSLALAGEGRWWVYGLFALGAAVMRSAGCIINDMWDRKLDAQVERTKARPLASGELSMAQAGVFLALLMAAGLLIAVMLGWAVVLWAALSLVLVVSYPLMKRITWWPQLFLGFTFNWGAFLGWVAARGEMEWPAVWLYISAVFWTLGYDTIYGHQDKKDDAKIGVRSSSRRLGDFTKPALLAFYMVFFLGVLLLCRPAGWGVVFFFLSAIQLLWQVAMVNLDEADSCKKIFCSNQWLGLILWLGISLSY